jgi:hypothetical protein
MRNWQDSILPPDSIQVFFPWLRTPFSELPGSSSSVRMPLPVLPKRKTKDSYDDQAPLSSRHFVPEKY